MPNTYLQFVSVDVWTLIFTWCNLFILYMIMKKLLFKRILSVLEQRQKEIDTMYDSANTANENAKNLEKEYVVKVAQAKDEAGEILKTATATANKREEEILQQAREKANLITERAHAQIEQEKKKAYEEIKGEIAQISVSIAEKMVEREINAKDHEALISQFIENVGEVK